jgi:hypothetical protein
MSNMFYIYIEIKTKYTEISHEVISNYKHFRFIQFHIQMN